jgi:PhnB protein
MKLIQKLNFEGRSGEAIRLYQEVFGCRVKSLIRYRDAVANGWEQPCPEKDDTVYHSEIYFGDFEVRFADTGAEDAELTRRVEQLVGFDTAEEVERAFALLSDGGEILMPLNRPPYMVIIGKVRDKFGIMWTLMCDF